MRWRERKRCRADERPADPRSREGTRSGAPAEPTAGGWKPDRRPERAGSGWLSIGVSAASSHQERTGGGWTGFSRCSHIPRDRHRPNERRPPTRAESASHATPTSARAPCGALPRFLSDSPACGRGRRRGVRTVSPKRPRSSPPGAVEERASQRWRPPGSEPNPNARYPRDVGSIQCCASASTCRATSRMAGSVRSPSSRLIHMGHRQRTRSPASVRRTSSIDAFRPLAWRPSTVPWAACIVRAPSASGEPSG